MAKKSLATLMKNAPNMSKKANELLHNRFILYFVFIIAVANLFHFVFSQDLMSVCVFIVVGLLTSFFSKNMVVIMVISIVVTHVVRFGNGGYEGFSNIEEQFQEALDAIDEVEKMADDDDEEKEGFEDDDEEELEEEEKEEEETETED
jgi:ABC-type multidrug transport system fused ATPase/permease subunit